MKQSEVKKIIQERLLDIDCIPGTAERLEAIKETLQWIIGLINKPGEPVLPPEFTQYTSQIPSTSELTTWWRKTPGGE